MMTQFFAIVGIVALLVAITVTVAVAVPYIKRRLPVKLTRAERLLIGIFLREKLEHEESDVSEELAACCDIPLEVIHQLEDESLVQLKKLLSEKRKQKTESENV